MKNINRKKSALSSKIKEYILTKFLISLQHKGRFGFIKNSERHYENPIKWVYTVKGQHVLGCLFRFLETGEGWAKFDDKYREVKECQ